MANPQLEDGFTRIANEILEALMRLQLPGHCWRVLLKIVRQTYGYNKKQDKIAIRQIAEATNLEDKHVCRAVNRLIMEGLILKFGNKKGSSYKFQKDYAGWLQFPKLGIPIPKIGNKTFPKLGDTKDNKEILKENTTALPCAKDCILEKGDKQKLAESAIRIGLAVDNGYRAVGRLWKVHGTLRAEPNRLAWYFNRIWHRRRAPHLPRIESPWAFIEQMIRERSPVPSVAEGGDDNYFRAHETVSYYCDPILGVRGRDSPVVRGGGFTELSTIGKESGGK